MAKTKGQPQRISGKAVSPTAKRRQYRHRRPRNAPRHPDAAYSVPDRHRRGWMIDVILLCWWLWIPACGMGALGLYLLRMTI